MKVYVTKYAMSTGTFVGTAERCGDSETMVKVGGSYFHGKDWHRDRGDAIRRVVEMRDAKVKSLRKSLQKIEAMVPDEAVPK
jgi:hypothetical protein